MFIKFEFDTDSEEGIYEEKKAKRMLYSTDAFILISDINELIRKHFKYGDENATAEKCLEEIQETIYESKLLDMLE